MTKKKLIAYEGRIDIDTEPAKLLGFTSDKFEVYSYLWKIKGDVYISAIQAKRDRSGNFKRMCETILGYGFVLKIPTPLSRMKTICLKNGFAQTFKNTDFGQCEIWVKQPTVDLSQRSLRLSRKRAGMQSGPTCE